MPYQGCLSSLGGPFRCWWCQEVLELLLGVREATMAKGWLFVVVAADVSTTSCIGDLGGGLSGEAALLLCLASAWSDFLVRLRGEENERSVVSEAFRDNGEMTLSKQLFLNKGSFAR